MCGVASTRTKKKDKWKTGERGDTEREREYWEVGSLKTDHGKHRERVRCEVRGRRTDHKRERGGMGAQRETYREKDRQADRETVRERVERRGLFGEGR